METEAIYQMVLEAAYDLGYMVVTIISDDDTTMKSNLKYSYKDLIRVGLMLVENWPLTKGANKKKL